MNGRSVRIFAGALVFVTFQVGCASASPFGFAADPDEFITNYNGFVFGGGFGNPNVAWVNGTQHPLQFVPSAALGYAWDNGGSNLTMQSATSGATFDFTSVDVYGDIRNGSHLTPTHLLIEGLKGGQIVDTYTTSTTLDDLPRDRFTTITLNWTNVDEIVFSPNGGGGGENVFLTNIDVDPAQVSAVPESSTWAMMIAGFAGLGFLVHRRRNLSAPSSMLGQGTPHMRLKQL